jgi:hypothetical protein
LINDSQTDSPLPPPVVAGRTPTAPDEIAAERRRLTMLQKRLFTRTTLPLFAASFPSFPLAMTSLGRVAGPTGPADAIEAKGPDGFTWTLFFDASTHLLAGISWKEKPIVVMTASSTMAVRSGRQGTPVTTFGRPPVLPGNPAGNLDEVQWQLIISDYRAADGLTWPHRFVSSYAGHKYEDLKLGAFKINAKIDPGVFRPTK